MKRRPRQLAIDLKYRGRGGPRKGAGRPRKPGGRVSHQRRPSLSPHHPVHVTLRVAPGVPSLRRIPAFRRIADAFHEGRERFGFRVVHCSVQGNHIHLIAEAENRVSLSRGMKGLEVRIARGVNEATGRRGPLFAERYHAHVLKSPREVRNAVDYVLANWFRHAGRDVGPYDLDRLSSVADRSLVVRPQTWLLRVGWEAV
jgi:REP element-mobilizing transposase RayT